MFSSFQDFVDQIFAPAQQETPAAHDHALRLAAAVLLVEAMRADAQPDAQERRVIQAALSKRFGLEDEELTRLIAQAEAQAGRANDYFHFTSLLNDRCSQADKIALVEAMWNVAYASGDADANEMHVISKVAGLLHVTHGEYIAAKLRAKEAAGLL